MGKYTSVKTKQEKPQLKVLNTGKIGFVEELGFCFITLNVHWKCGRTAVVKDSNII